MSQNDARPVILAVDDAEDLLALIGKALAGNYEVKLATDGGEALTLAAAAPQPDLILLDVEMPGATGFEICLLLKEDPATAHIPVIFLTGRVEPAEQLEGLDAGAVDYLTKPINAKLLLARVRIHLALAGRQAALEREVQQRTAQLEDARSQLIRRLARAMEFHESAAAGNRVARISQYARLIAQAAGMKPEVAELLQKASPLYDIGKMGVPAEVLRKPGKLSAPELERVRRHPQLGAEIIGEHQDPVLALAAKLALTHHERWDGTGYPKKLKGNDIPWPGRAMALVDAFESMTTTQFYRQKPLTIDEAAKLIKDGFGTQFDPSLAEAFAKALPMMRKVRDAYSDALGDLINLDFSPTRNAPAAAAAEAPPKAAPARAAPAKPDVAAKAAAAVAAARARLRAKR
ncbi:MAG: response regulator [Betaproteobacteria bacterium]|nr:response regulator [Betaproteobacteria bacterium]